MAGARQGNTTYVAYESRRGGPTRVAIFQDGSRTARISSPFPGLQFYTAARHLSASGGEIRVLATHQGSDQRDCPGQLFVRLFALDAATLRHTRALHACLPGYPGHEPQIQAIGPEEWYVIGSNFDEGIVWRVRAADDQLSVRTIYESNGAPWRTMRSALSASGDLLLFPRDGPLEGGAIPVLRINREGVVQEERLTPDCATPPRRFSAAPSVDSDGLVIAGFNNCTNIWRFA